MIKIKNPRTAMILSVILNDIENKEYSTITNNEIANEVGLSVFTVRDKVRKLIKDKVLQSVQNVWLSKDEFYNRVLYKGTEKYKLELLDSK